MNLNYLKKINRNDRRTIRWNLFFNYTSVVYNVIIGIVLVPLYLKYIPIDEYGAWLASGNIITWMTLLDPGLSGTMQYKVAHALGNNDKKTIGKLIGNSIVIGICFFITLCLGAIFVQFNISKWLDVSKFSEASFFLALALTSISTCIMMFSFSIAGINMGLQSSLGIGIIFTVMNIFGIVSTIYFLKMNFGLLAFGYTGMLRALIYFGGHALYLLGRVHIEKYKIAIDTRVLKELTSLLGYNFLGKTAGTLQGRIFDFLIAKYISLGAVASFRISLSGPDNSKLVLVRPTVSISPILSKLHGGGDLESIKHRLKQMVFFFIWVSSFIFGAFIIFNKSFVSLWVAKDLYVGNITNILICIMVGVASLSEILSQFVWALGEMRKNNLATTIQFGIFLPLAILLCINFGINGLLGASIFSYLSVTIWYFSYIISSKLTLKLKGALPFFKEIILVFVIISVNVIIFQNILILTWLKFFSNCLLFSGAFLLSLYFVSGKFRDVLSVQLFDKIRNRMS